jgi:4-oxalocrotonate tautomerase
MPILNVKLCAPPSPVTSAKIAAALTDLTVDILGKKRELTAVAIEFTPPSEWFIAGTSLASQSQHTFYLDIKITEGTNTKDQKAAYINRVFSAVESIIGPLAEASYIVVHDVRGDSWGYQGKTQEFRYIRGKAL